MASRESLIEELRKLMLNKRVVKIINPPLKNRKFDEAVVTFVLEDDEKKRSGFTLFATELGAWVEYIQKEEK